MTTTYLAPDPIQSTQLIPGGNTPANGGQLFFYAAGSSTKQTVYKDNAGAVQWANPIVLDSGGNLPSGGVVWFASGQTYKVVFAPSTDTDPPVSPYWTKDNLAGINDTSSSQSEWVSGPTPTFVSATQFTLAGDQTGTFTNARRMKFSVTAGTVYGNVTSVSFAVGTTTVNVAFDSGALDSGLTAVSYSLIAPSNSSISADYVNKQVTSVASAGNGTTNIWGVAGNTIHITGTNSIFNFSSAPYSGARRSVIADGIFTLKHNATTLALPGLADIVTLLGDRFEVEASTSANAVILQYTQNSHPGGRLLRQAIYTTTNPSTTHTTGSGTNLIEIEIYGGGGAGGGTASTGPAQYAAGAGASAGGVGLKRMASAPSSTYAVTVGPAGTGVAGANGQSGSTTSFGGFLSVTGGGAGTLGPLNVGVGGVAPGTSSSSDVNATGAPGIGSVVIASVGQTKAGDGGSSRLGGGGIGIVNTTLPGGTATGFSAGGGGAAAVNNQPAQAGGNGSPGLVIIREYS